MRQLRRITLNSEVMGESPASECGLLLALLLGLLTSGRVDDILNAYPYLEREDIYEAIA